MGQSNPQNFGKHTFGGNQKLLPCTLHGEMTLQRENTIADGNNLEHKRQLRRNRLNTAKDGDPQAIQPGQSTTFSSADPP